MLTPQRRLSTAFHILLTVVIIGCSQRAEHADSTNTNPTSKPFKVALLTPGPISDQSWNGGAYQGLMRIKDSLGATVSHIQTKTPAEFEEQFRQYGAQGYNLVFGHGFEFQDAAKRVGPEFPRTIYITTSGSATGANVAGMEFAFADASYLAGMLAGYTTHTNTLGVIGGTELPPVKESFDAFEEGARAVNPKVQIIRSYIGNWDDVSAGKEQALAQINRGVDIIFQNADAAGLGIFQAARESGKTHIIGSNSNQNSIAPEVTLGSVVIDLPHAFITVAREVKDGHFKPRVIRLGTASNVVSLVFNPQVQPAIAAPVQRAVDSVRAEMIAGRFAPRAGKH